jgi:hypothetical protein
MHRVRASNLCYRRHNIPGHKKAVAGIVYGNMVDNGAEERGKRARAATSIGIKKL